MGCLRLALLFFISLLPSYVLKIPSSIPTDPVVSHTETNMPPSPHQWNSAQTQMQSGKFLSIIHPSFHPIHPSRPTSKEDGATDAALASAAPPLKGHTCSLLWAAVFRWNDRWHQNIILEKRRQNCRPERSRLSSCLSIADLRSCCRLYILPDNTESRAHAQWRRTGRSRDPQLTALLLTENEENMALTVWTSCVLRLMSASLCSQFACLGQNVYSKCYKKVNNDCILTAYSSWPLEWRDNWIICGA